MMLLRGCALLPLIAAGALSQDDLMVPVGVCGHGGEAFECWDMQGRRDPEMLRKLDVRLVDREPQSPFRFVRYAVFKEREPFGGLYVHRNGSDILPAVLSETERLCAFRILVSPSQNEFVFDLSYLAPLAKEFEIPFRNEANWSEGSVRFGVGKVFEVKGERLLSAAVLTSNRIRPLPRFVHSTGVRMWEVIVGAEPSPDQYVHASFTPLDAKGKVIQYVDREGHPVPPNKAEMMIDFFPPAGREDLSAKVFRATFAASGFGAISPAGWCDTNISPKTIRKLRVKLSQLVQVGTRTFPNHPK
jgi:hypothetical protein